MKVYNYNKDFYFTGERDARLDPISGQPMLPANATFTAPPATSLSDHQNYKFNTVSGAWDVVSSQEQIDVLMSQSNDKGVLLYELDVNGDPVLKGSQAIANEDAAIDKGIALEQAETSMRSDIFAELEVVFGTKSSETATATAMTWDLMFDNSADYADLGLVSEFDLVGIVKGGALDTADKIADYAGQLKARKLEYSKYRLDRIEKYKSEVLALNV